MASGESALACEPDAQTALGQLLKRRPDWLAVQSQLVTHPRHHRPGRPRQDATPDHHEWQIAATLTVDDEAVTRAVRRKAAFLVATNVVDPDQLSDQELIQTYKDQGSVERGFAFLKDPLFLASSVFVKKPSRIIALSLIMVLCLLVYRLAEHRLREQLAATGQTIPDQLKRPTRRPTMRWIFQCFEGIDLLHLRQGLGHTTTLVLRLEPLHQQVLALALLGPTYEQFY